MSNSAPRPTLSRTALVGWLVWVVLLLGISLWMGQQSHHWLPVQASTTAPLVDDLFSGAIGTFIFFGVVSVMVWWCSLTGPRSTTRPTPFRLRATPEVIWTAIPFVLVMAIALDDSCQRQVGDVGADGAHPSGQRQ